MKLNNGSCNTITMNGNFNVKLADGTHLGRTVTTHAKPNAEISTRIAATMPVLHSLELFGKETKCSNKLKINVHNAVVMSKLIYGLETSQFTDYTLNRINTFQMNGPRTILGVPPTFIDKDLSHRSLLELANKEVKTEKDKHDKRILASEMIGNRRLTLPGRSIGSGDEDPLRQVALDDKHLEAKKGAIRSLKSW